jgi:hypothetical protein
LHALAPGLTPRSVLEKFAAVQMIDVHLPTADGRELVLTRYTEPEPELKLEAVGVLGKAGDLGGDREEAEKREQA